MWTTKKKGGEFRDQQLMLNFRECLDFCGLIDLDFTGADFTWACRRANGMVWCRLDRFCVTSEWISNYSEYVVKHQPASFLTTTHSYYIYNRGNNSRDNVTFGFNLCGHEMRVVQRLSIEPETDRVDPMTI